MCSSHYSVTINAPKNNDTFYLKTKFSFFLCVALNLFSTKHRNN